MPAVSIFDTEQDPLGMTLLPDWAYKAANQVSPMAGLTIKLADKLAELDRVSPLNQVKQDPLGMCQRRHFVFPPGGLAVRSELENESSA